MGIAIAGSNEPILTPQGGHLHFDLNFWVSVVMVTGVPAMAWFLIKSSVRQLTKSLQNMITCEQCSLRQVKCQKNLLEKLPDKFAPKHVEEKLEGLQKEKERTHGEIYNEIKANREKVIAEMGVLNTSTKTSMAAILNQGLEEIKEVVDALKVVVEAFKESLDKTKGS